MPTEEELDRELERQIDELLAALLPMDEVFREFEPEKSERCGRARSGGE